MRRVTANVVLPCTPESFWRVFLDPAYTRAFYVDELACKELTVLELTEGSRRLRIVPRTNLPGVLARLVGERFAYEERGRLDPVRNEWAYQMVQPARLEIGRASCRERV